MLGWRIQDFKAILALLLSKIRCSKHVHCHKSSKIWCFRNRCKYWNFLKRRAIKRPPVFPVFPTVHDQNGWKFAKKSPFLASKLVAGMVEIAEMAEWRNDLGTLNRSQGQIWEIWKKYPLKYPQGDCHLTCLKHLSPKTNRYQMPDDHRQTCTMTLMWQEQLK